MTGTIKRNGKEPRVRGFILSVLLFLQKSLVAGFPGGAFFVMDIDG